MNKSPKFSPEVRERAVRMVHEHRDGYSSLWVAVESISPKIGGVPQTLLEWVARAEIDSGRRDGLTTTEPERFKALERENREFRVHRQFTADRPNPLWVSGFTYVSTWKGWLYVAFVVDLFARRILGWRVSPTMTTDFVLGALDQALHGRQPADSDGLVHHSDRGSQCVSLRYTERLAEAGIAPSVGSRGDSYDSALAETINGLYKAELIHRRGPWKSREAVELATLEWVSWFNHQRLMEPLGYIPPAEAGANHHRQPVRPRWRLDLTAC